MLFLLFGSSAAGKTAALEALQGRVARLALHDFDEIGVPVGADTGWRQRANEEWLRRALAYESEGIDLLLTGQTPLGELLATPSAPLVEAISACLLDCDDHTRTARMNARGSRVACRHGWEDRGLPELGGMDAISRHRPTVATGGDPRKRSRPADELGSLE